MKKRIRRIIAVLVVAVMLLQVMWIPGSTVAEAATETTTVTYDVTYYQTNARSMLDMVNEFRTGEDAWYWNEDDTTKTVCSGLSELTYDYTLEEIAMQRAAEIALSFSHTRTNGERCYTAYDEASATVVWTTRGENIAAGQTSAAKAFESWKEDAYGYSGQGHRRNMLNSEYNAIGIACVYYNGTYFWVQELCKTSNINTTATTANDSSTTVSADVLCSDVTSATLSADPTSCTMVTGETDSVPTVTASFAMTNSWWMWKTICSVTVSPTWTVGDSTLLSISDDGTMTALASGTTTITASALGTSISVPVTIKPSITECTISLSPTSYTYDGTAKTPAVTVTLGSTTLTEGTDYTLTYSNNVNAGTATVTIDGAGDYAGSVTKEFTINKADYTAEGYEQVVVAGQATTGISLDLSDAVMAGGSLGTPMLSGTGAALVDSIAVSGTAVTFDTTSQADGTVATITVPVTGCTNYNNYDITITVTAKAVAIAVDGDISGYTGIAIDTTTVMLTITGGTAKFAGTLTGSWITNLPAGLTQSITRVSDTEVTITVSGTPTAAVTDSLAITIPAGNLTQVSGDFTVTGGSIDIEEATYELTLTDISGNFTDLTYGYTSGNSVTYTFENTGNQDITGLSAETTDGFTVSLVSRSNALSGITVAAGETVTLVVTSDTGLHAGTTTGTLTLNWTGAEAKLTESLSQTVNKKALTVAADSLTVEYGDAAPSYTATYSGFVTGEDASVLTGTLTFACDYRAGSDVGTYTVTPSGLSSDDYEITYQSGTLTVDQRTAELVWTALTEANLVYTGTAKTLTATVGNAVSGDVVSVTAQLSGDNVNVTGSGFYYTAIELTGADSGNYKLPENVTSATYKITPADVVITVANASKTYGDADPTLTGSVSGTLSEADLEALKISYSREAGENAGTYTINASYTANSNYTVSVVEGVFTINKKAITVTAEDKTSVYGDVLQALTFEITSGSLVSGDTADDLAVTLVKEAGTDAGTYTISGSSAAANYDVTVVSGTYTITKAQLTVTAKDNAIVYGDAPSDNGATYSGLAGDDTAAAFDGELTFTYTYSRYGDVGTYTITPSGLSSDNYDITYVSGTLTVEPKTAELVWTLEAEDLIYDGTAKEVTVSVGNLAKADDEVIVKAVLTGDNVNVTTEGFSYTVTEFAGADSGNYTLPANLTSSVYYVTARELAGSDFTVSQTDGTDTVIISLDGSAAFDYTGSAFLPDVAVNGGSLVEAGDYTVTYGENTAVGTGTVTITGQGNFTGTLVYTFSIVDQTAPTGEMTIDVNKWNSFWNTVTFGLFFNKTQTVTVTASDAESGVATTEYYLAGEAVETAAELAEAEWTEFEDSFDIDPDITCVVYVRITDKAGNSTIINSDGIVLDATAPVITGIEDGGAYCGDVTFTVTDEHLDYVLIDEEAAVATETGYTISADGAQHTVEAVDQAGNVTTLTVTVYSEHVWVYTVENETDTEATITETCSNCGETASVTISVPAGDLVDDGTSHDVTVTYSGTLAGGNDLTVTYEKDGEIVTDTTAAGTYTATVTYGGETISVTFTVLEAETDPGTDGGDETGGSTGTDSGDETGGSTGTDSGDETGGSTGTDSGDETGGSTGTDSGDETGGSTGTDNGEETGGSTGTETGSETGSNTSGTETGSNTATGTNTGDSGHTVLWILLMMLSAAAVVVLVKGRKKVRDNA